MGIGDVTIAAEMGTLRPGDLNSPLYGLEQRIRFCISLGVISPENGLRIIDILHDPHKAEPSPELIVPKVKKHG